MNVLPILNNTKGIDYGKVSALLKYRPDVTIVVFKPGQDILDHIPTAAPKTILLGTDGDMLYIDPPSSLKATKTTHLVSPKSPMYKTCRAIIRNEAPSTYPAISWRNQ